MGQQALVDTGVLYSAFVRRDEYHDTGLAIVRDADRDTLPQLVVLDFVLAETMNALTQQLTPEQTRETLEMLEISPGFEIARTTSAVWTRSFPTYKRLDALSFVDTLLVSYAHEHDCPYLYSFDTGFDQVDTVQRLNTNTNPYAP